MKRLQIKLRSQSGASILLALLMLLICMMVAASILAAAASNAGKIRSNRVEQQKYLNLSSAIQLVCDELEQMEYTGKYEVYEWTVTETVTGNDPDTNEPVTKTIATDYFCCEQIEGDYSCGMRRDPAPNGELTEYLPLGKELDEIFGGQFTGDGYKKRSAANAGSYDGHTLAVKLPAGLEGYPYPAGSGLGGEIYEAPDIVKVTVKLNDDTHHITVTAWLDNGENTPPADGQYTMTAELVAMENTSPVLDYNPGGRTPLKEGETRPAGGGKVSYTRNGDTANAARAPMKWKLNWIKK